MHTLLICMSEFAESTNYLYGLCIWHYLLYGESLNNTLIKPIHLSVNITHLLSNDAHGMAVLVEQCLQNILL